MGDPDREAILARVRQALSRPSPTPHWHHVPIAEGPVFPVDTTSRAALSQRFRHEFQSVHGEILQASDMREAAEIAARWMDSAPFRNVAAVKCPLNERVLAKSAAVHWIEEPVAHAGHWESWDLGVTPCEALVAESGSVVVSAAQSGRALSVLPPTHLVIATADQVVPDLESALARMGQRYPGVFPSSLSVITGPSRTADIEKILVLGAHGPRKLAVLLIDAE